MCCTSFRATVVHRIPQPETQRKRGGEKRREKKPLRAVLRAWGRESYHPRRQNRSERPSGGHTKQSDRQRRPAPFGPPLAARPGARSGGLVCAPGRLLLRPLSAPGGTWLLSAGPFAARPIRASARGRTGSLASCLRLPFPCRCPCRQSKAVAASCASRRAGRGGFGPVGRRPAPLSFRRLARPTRARCVVLRPGVGSAENSCSRSWWRRALRPAPCSARGHCFGRVGGVGRSSARRLAPFPPRGAFAPPPFPRRALFGPPMRYFYAGGRGFALGPRLRRVVAGGARALPRRFVCGRLRLRLRGRWPLLASRAPPLRRSPGPVGGGAARLVPGRFADGSERASSYPPPQTFAGQTPRRPRQQGYGSDAAFLGGMGYPFSRPRENDHAHTRRAPTRACARTRVEPSKTCTKGESSRPIRSPEGKKRAGCRPHPARL